MGAFKEPQPRKNSAAEDAKKVIGGNWPPYAREGGEANWQDYPTATEVEQKLRTNKPSPNAQWTMSETEFNQSLATAREEGRVKAFDDLEYRKAALEAALGLGLEPNHHGALFWDNLNTFEAYLRDGTKPS